MCAREGFCLAWTYTRLDRRCQLKRAIPVLVQRRPEEGFVSGTSNCRNGVNSPVNLPVGKNTDVRMIVLANQSLILNFQKGNEVPDKCLKIYNSGWLFNVFLIPGRQARTDSIFLVGGYRQGKLVPYDEVLLATSNFGNRRPNSGFKSYLNALVTTKQSNGGYQVKPSMQ